LLIKGTRKRHVKCDETKPACNRCLKWQGFCDGYGGNSSSSSKVKTEDDDIDPCLLSDIRTTPFLSQQESDYFNAWLYLSKTLCRDPMCELYTVTIPQLGMEDPVIMEVVLAVGSLKFAIDSQPKELPKRYDRYSSEAYRHALARYGRALQRIVAMSVTPETIRTILICCNLLVCFDLLDGNRSAVHKHIFHGSRILQAYLTSVDPDSDLRTATASPAPYVINDLVLQAFQRMGTISYSHLVLEMHVRRRHPTAAETYYAGRKADLSKVEMPARFADFSEACKSLDMLWKGMVDIVDAYMRRQRFKMHQAPLEGEDWAEDRRQLLGLLMEWNGAYAHIFEGREMFKESKWCVRSVVLLKMQWLIGYICTYSSHCLDFQALVELEGMFRETVDLAELLPVVEMAEKDEDDGADTVTPLPVSSPSFSLFGWSSPVLLYHTNV
jgi:hypothetical protein